MAFSSSNFDPTASGSKGALRWMSYKTPDNTATVSASGYFDEMASLITTGDCILVECSDGTDIYRLINTAGVITVGVGLHFA